MIEVPKRSSLLDQIVSILRGHLRSAAWQQGLPPERELSERMQVSRTYLRAALKTLSREGLVRLSEDRRRWLPTRARRHVTAAGSKLVGLLTSESFDSFAPSTLFDLYHLRRHLQDAGMSLEVVTDTRLTWKSPARALDEIVSRVKASCWVLHRTSAPIQRWFSERDLPAIVMGMCHKGVRLPSIDFDYRALSAHAVGQFLRLGHRRMALVVPGTGLAGNLARERSFIEAVEKSDAPDAVPVVLRHHGTAGHIHSLLRTSVRGKTAPTAILVSHAEHLLSVLTHLLRHGIRVPEDMSVVSSGDEWFLSFLTPTVACYRLNWDAYARRLSRMAVQLASTGALPKQPILLMPQFQNGESLAAR